MKILQFILISLLLLLCINCGKDTPADQGTEAKEKAKTVESIENKIVLEINDKEFSNEYFQHFIKVKHPDFSSSKPKSESEIQLTPKLLSRLFDSFVDQKVISFIADQMNIPVNEEEINNHLTKLNISGDSIDKNLVIESIKVQKYLYYKVYDNIDVSKEEIRHYYNTHRHEFQSEMQVLLYQILVKDRETAVKIRAKLNNNPRQFEEIAKQQSISMEAHKGGLMGYFEKGTLPEDMENVVFSLNPYSISPVVESSYGFHIFKVTKKKEGQKLYLDKVKDEIKNKLLAEKMGNAYEEFLAKAKQELSININHDQLYFEYQQIDTKI